MDDNKLAIVKILQRKTCCFCDHVLSVAPIKTEGRSNEFYKCGRCKWISCRASRDVGIMTHVMPKLSLKFPISIRLSVFEDIAQHLPVPCSYPDCKKVMPWNRVEKHERNCFFRTMKCPTYQQNCSDVIQVDLLKEHFKEKHESYLINNSIFETTTISNTVFLLHVDNESFIIYTLATDQIAVLATKRSKYTKFSVTFPADNFTASFCNLPVALYQKSNCLNCMKTLCTRLRNDLFRSLDDSRELIRFKVQITLVADETYSGDLDQSREEETDEKEEMKMTPLESNVEAERKGFTCPYCMNYMVPPIFTCPNGHTICNECRSRLKYCPLCTLTLGESRNYTLEDLVNDIKIACQYNSYGCTYWSATSEMSQHETDCTFKDMFKK